MLRSTKWGPGHFLRHFIHPMSRLRTGVMHFAPFSQSRLWDLWNSHPLGTSCTYRMKDSCTLYKGNKPVLSHQLSYPGFPLDPLASSPPTGLLHTHKSWLFQNLLANLIKVILLNPDLPSHLYSRIKINFSTIINDKNESLGPNKDYN